MLCYLVILLILYICLDVNYFVRSIITVVGGYFFQKKRKITETTIIFGICTTQDIDLFLTHMNNARYIRELDFARFHFYALTGIYDEAKKRGTTGVQAATSIRYRREIRLFRPYRIETRIIWWDEKAIYLEHKFITLFDNFVRSVVLSKSSIIKCDVCKIMKESFPEAVKPLTIPTELQLWIQSNDFSSQQLRKEN